MSRSADRKPSLAAVRFRDLDEREAMYIGQQFVIVERHNAEQI